MRFFFSFWLFTVMLKKNLWCFPFHPAGQAKFRIGHKQSSSILSGWPCFSLVVYPRFNLSTEMQFDSFSAILRPMASNLWHTVKTRLISPSAYKATQLKAHQFGSWNKHAPAPLQQLLFTWTHTTLAKTTPPCQNVFRLLAKNPYKVV